MPEIAVFGEFEVIFGEDFPSETGNQLGWPTGFEPATSGTTIRGSTIELRPPFGPDNESSVRSGSAKRIFAERSGQDAPTCLTGHAVEKHCNHAPITYDPSLIWIREHLSESPRSASPVEVRCGRTT
jgi:hypothetical protein